MTLIYIKEIFELIFYNNDVRFIILEEATAQKTNNNNNNNNTERKKTQSHKIIAKNDEIFCV